VWGEALDGQIITNCPKCPNWAFKILSYKAWIIKGRWRYTICQSFSTTDTSAFGEGVWRGTTWTSRRYKRPSLSNAQTSLFDVTTTKNNTMTVLEVITMLSMVLLIKYSTWTKNYSVFVFKFQPTDLSGSNPVKAWPQKQKHLQTRWPSCRSTNVKALKKKQKLHNKILLQ